MTPAQLFALVLGLLTVAALTVLALSSTDFDPCRGAFPQLDICRGGAP